ncbi:MAG: hypothetical protein R2688_09445 [Fimbriimonadaceae bacterium]
MVTNGNINRFDLAGNPNRNGLLHFHGFENQQLLAHFYAIANGDRDFHNLTWHGGSPSPEAAPPLSIGREQIY